MNAITQTSPDSLESRGDSLMQLVTFYVGGQVFGVSALQVRDILRQQPLTQIPLSAKEIAGTMNLRGHIVTAIDLRARLRLPPREPESRFMCVVVEEFEDQYSLLVDSVGDVVTTSPSDMVSNPASLAQHWADLSEGILRLDEQLLIVLDVKKLLTI